MPILPRRREPPRPDAINVLLQEWKICEEGIGRYDTLTFAVRGWALSILIAAIAAAVASKTPELVLAAAGSTFTFWLVDALNKTYQRQFIDRAKELEVLLDRASRSPDGVLTDASYPRLSSKFETHRKKKWRAFPEVMKAALEMNVLMPYVAMAFVIAVSTYIIPRPPADSAPSTPATFAPALPAAKTPQIAKPLKAS